MIKLVFNGYYKSGSTRMWWIMKRSNPEMLHIYEPLSPGWLNLKEFVFSHLHGLPIWEDYYRPEFKQIEDKWAREWEKLRSKYKWDILPRSVEEVAPMFDLLHELKIPVIIQPNRCHLILNGLAKRYGCKFIHIIRNPIDTWIAHTIEPTTSKPSFRENFKVWIKKLLFSNRTNFIGKYVLLKNMTKRPSIGKSYFLDSVYELVSEFFGYDRAKDYLDKLLIVWTHLNYEAWKQVQDNSIDGMVVYYEWIVKAPRFWFEKMKSHSGVKFSKKYANELSPRFITISEDLRKEFVDRLDELGLLNIVEYFYPPHWWFG